MIRSLTLLLLLPSAATAWNALGHKTVAEIAWRQLEPNQRQEIVEVIRRHPRFDADFIAKLDDDSAKDAADQDHWVFQHAATWADITRGNKEFDRPVWHYVDFPIYVDSTDRQAFGGKVPVNLATEYPSNTPINEYNIVQAIQHCRAAIRSNAGPNVKAVAYCWLFHLVGDIHQPLHSTALFSMQKFPKGDRGGNDIKLVRGENLHKLWDNLLGRQYYMRNVQKTVTELSDRNRFGDVWDTAARQQDPIKWAGESHELCESFVYDRAILDAVRANQSPIQLPDSYYQFAGEHARKRIIAAGLRLAAILKQP